MTLIYLDWGLISMVSLQSQLTPYKERKLPISGGSARAAGSTPGHFLPTLQVGPVAIGQVSGLRRTK